MQNHAYFTAAARSLFGDKKRQNLRRLAERLRQIQTS
jgi:hypothetical protein